VHPGIFIFSTLWHLLNFLRNIAAGWLMQLFGDVAYKICWRSVAIYSIDVNSIPHVNNPVCFTVIPETESKEVIQGTYCHDSAAPPQNLGVARGKATPKRTLIADG
jgi:hypothetical protein